MARKKNPYGMQNYTKSDKVAKIIEQKILSREYQVGQQLPTQDEFSSFFSVSTRCIREAFKILEAKGLIEIGQGRRGIVKSDNLDTLIENLSASMINKSITNRKLINDLLEVRMNLEVSSARTLSRLSDREFTVKALYAMLTRLELLVQGLEKNADPRMMKEVKDLDYDFHTMIMHSNNNVILNTILNDLGPQLKKVLEETEETVAELRRKTLDYRYLVDAIRDGNTDLAVALTLTVTSNIKTKVDKLDF